MVVVVTVSTLIVLAFNICIILGIGFFDKIFNKEFFQYVFEIINCSIYNFQYVFEIIDAAISEFGVYLFVYILEAIVIFILASAFSLLLMFCCIALASLITRKGRVATAIAIYYGVNCVLSFVMEMVMIFGVRGIGIRLEALSDKVLYPTVAVILLAIILLFGLASVMLYTLQYFMVDRKLNLN